MGLGGNHRKLEWIGHCVTLPHCVVTSWEEVADTQVPRPGAESLQHEVLSDITRLFL